MGCRPRPTSWADLSTARAFVPSPFFADRCSKVWPCSNCEKRGQASICPQGKLKTGKERIAELEAALLAATTSAPAGSATTAAAAGEPQPLHPLLQSTAYDETPSPPDTGSFGHDAVASTRASSEKGKERADDSDEITPPSGHLAISGVDSGSSKYFGDGGSVYLLVRLPAPTWSRSADRF